MKDKTMSKKHDRHGSKRSGLSSRDSAEDSESYRHVLKERHYKDDEKNKRKDKDRSGDIKQTSEHSHKRKRSKSPHQSSHRKASPSKSKGVTDSSKNHRSHKRHGGDINESYEELSRRKRKLESELRALDLEEAAAKEAEVKKTRRDRSDKVVKKETEKRYEETTTSTSEDEKGWGNKPQQDTTKPTNKEKPNFATSGKLAEETNTYNGVVIKYNEPSEARKPKRRWRLYPFKGDSDLPFIPIHRQSAYLFGRTRLIADIPIDHPSCSKQHAVLQFRLVPYKRDDGTNGRRVRPYIIDLESSNGTFVNNNRVDPRCYVELVEKDVIKFGYSSREYVLLHEESKYNEEDDDVVEGELD